MAPGPWDLDARIDAMLTTLSSDPRVEVLLVERQPPLSLDALERIQAELGWELDPRFVAFFRANNGLRVFWVDASFEPEEDTPDRPWEHWLQARSAEVPCGSIQVPTLEEILFEPSDFEGFDLAYGEHIATVLGQWDMTMFYERLKEIDDYEHDLGMGSYFMPGMVLDPLYPDPVVIFSDDYKAAVDATTPMLAREYLDMVVATLGIERARRDRFGYAGDPTTTLFLAPQDWLRDFPDASQVLDALFSPGANAPTRRRVQSLSTMEGRPVQASAYASYVDTTLHDSKRIPEDSPSVRVIRKEDFEWNHWVLGGRAVYEQFPENHPMVIPILDHRHYRVENPMTSAYMPVSTIRTLIGAPVKFHTPRQTPSTQVACLIGIDLTSNRADPRLWYFWASFSDHHDGTWHFGSYQYNHVLLSELAWIGLAIPDFHHDW